ncbi:YheC/YheD family protein [Bacillus sp. FJAT-49705]|uniref:YheC/YheD family protein n=1 Tax=Cytobacillus citreus TaxID=2833586 RepID=A0ABS5NMC8_9BACI|nr:YheC/YheD family protein [Cytobacillus citreus]MBS4188751.1 YheC/YheD family protein [Cytobacillus citreus]
MNLYYSLENKEWFTHSSERLVTIGSHLHPVKKYQTIPAENLLAFNIDINNSIPLIGILTGRNKDNNVIGNGQLFKELQKEILKNGGISVVFTPQNISDSLNGFIFVPNEDKWFPVKSPLPHVVYNRVPFRKQEKSISFYKTYQYFQSKQIPFFNAFFLNKFEVNQLLSRDPYLQPFIPETIIAAEESSLLLLLNKHKSLYLKPALGSKGSGIYQIYLNQDGSIKMNGLKNCFTFKDFLSFWGEWGPKLMEKTYIAQEAITPLLYKGKRFDFRVLVHFSKNRYQPTGIGIRQSQKQEITTHIPNGGLLIPYHHIQTKEHDQFFADTAHRIGLLLSEEMGFFGEFSIDVGISSNGKYVIYEINSKPMRFDEEEIEKKRIHLLTELFFEFAGLR